MMRYRSASNVPEGNLLSERVVDGLLDGRGDPPLPDGVGATGAAEAIVCVAKLCAMTFIPQDGQKRVLS